MLAGNASNIDTVYYAVISSFSFAGVWKTVNAIFVTF